MCVTIKLTKDIGTTVCLTPGGYNKRAWAFNLEDLSGRIYNTTSENLEDFVVAVGKRGYKAVGRKEKNTAGATWVPSDSGGSWNHSVGLKFYSDNMKERKAIHEFVKSEEMVVFMQAIGNDGQDVIEVFGLNNGLNTASSVYAGGTLQTDERSITVTKEGLESSLPWIFKSALASTLEDDIAFLDAMLVVQVA